MTTPPTPYRNEIETLEARKRVLENELESIEARIKERRRLPLLDQVKVASPCPAKWEDMVGDEQKRFCLSCDKHVFNLSALSREDAEQLLQANAGGEVCVRYYQRADGTIMTSDCAVGVTRKRRKKLALAVAGAGALAFGAVASYMRSEARMMTGATSVPMTVLEPVTDGPPDGRWVVGEAPPPSTATGTPTAPPTMEAPAPPPEKHVVGRVQTRR